MSLICIEIGRDIEYGEILRAGTRQGAGSFSALSQEVIERIPESERRSTPCEPADGGVDIHEASSGRNFNGSYTWSGFRHGKFLFSISQEAAEKYLPRLVKEFQALAGKS
jgi:hypothetical protein